MGANYCTWIGRKTFKPIGTSCKYYSLLTSWTDSCHVCVSLRREVFFSIPLICTLYDKVSAGFSCAVDPHKKSTSCIKKTAHAKPAKNVIALLNCLGLLTCP